MLAFAGAKGLQLRVSVNHAFGREVRRILHHRDAVRTVARTGVGRSGGVKARRQDGDRIVRGIPSRDISDLASDRPDATTDIISCTRAPERNALSWPER